MTGAAEKVAIYAQEVCKYYPVLKSSREKLDYLIHAALRSKDSLLNKTTIVKALDQISFQIGYGERVGVIGRNGAGKTTLLNLLSKGSELTKGKLAVTGTIYNLTSVQVGFDGNLSGRENAYSYLMRTGLPPEKINEKIQIIESFVELGSYFDQPVKYYSVGMQMRTEFAVATTVEADIITIDELLGSGDPYWVEKCAARLHALCSAGSTFLIVSHSLEQIMRYCNRTLWIENGKLVMDGETKEVVRHYETFLERLSWMSNDIDDKSLTLSKVLSIFSEEYLEHPECRSKVLRFPGLKEVCFSGIWINNENARKIIAPKNKPIRFRILLKAKTTGTYRLRYIITFWLLNGKRAAIFENELEYANIDKDQEHETYAVLAPEVLAVGRYQISFSLFNLSNSEESAADEKSKRLDMIWKSFELYIESGESERKFSSMPDEVFTVPVQASLS